MLISVTCFGFVAYAATRYVQGMSAYLLIVLYGVPTCVGIGSLVAAFHLDVTRRLSLLLLAASLSVGLVAGEIVLGVAVSTGANIDDPEADTRSMREVVRDLRARGVDAYPDPGAWTFRQLRLEVDGSSVVPLAAGLSDQTIVFCNETGEWVTYRSGPRGFRNPSHAWQEPTRIGLLGDSYVQGQCVRDDQTFGAHLRRHWPGTVNLGVRGSGPLHQLAVLHEYGRVVEPEVVVWFYYEGNDFGDMENELRSPSLRCYLEGEPDPRLIERRRAVEEKLRAALDSIIRTAPPNASAETAQPLDPKAIVKLSRLRAALGAWSIHFPEEPLGRLPDIVDKAQQTVRGWGGRLLFVTLPSYQRFTPLGSAEERRTEWIIRAVRDRGIDVVDGADVFLKATPDPRAFWFHAGTHYTPEGYRLIADAVQQRLSVIMPDGR